jgi:hypothetical protein
MTKASLRLLLTLILLTIQGSLLICGEDDCWNYAVSLSQSHPLHQLLLKILMRIPIPFSTIQHIAQVLLVVEAVVLLNLLFKFVCTCILWTLQILLAGGAMHLCFLLSQQDLQTSITNFKLWLEYGLDWMTNTSQL